MKKNTKHFILFLFLLACQPDQDLSDLVVNRAPTSPAGIEVIALSANEVTLSWDNSTDEDGTISLYRIYLNGTFNSSVETTTATISGLIPETNYTFQISAVDDKETESMLSASLEITTASEEDITPPSVPEASSPTGLTPTAVVLNWQASSDDESTVIVYEIRNGGTLLGSTEETSFSVADLEPNTTYTFEIRAIDEAGNASDALTIEVTTPNQADAEAPTIPANLAASNTDTNSTDLNWDASSDNVGVTAYKVYQDGTEVAEVSETTYSATGLSGATTYSFEVSAVDAAGNESARSTALSVTTETPSDTEAPTVPTNLSASNTDTNSTDLSWNASTDNVGVTGYKVYQDGTEITEVAGTSFSVTGLSSTTTYSFEVSAVDAEGNESARSTALSVTTDTPSDTEAPSVPENLSASNTDTDSTDLSWDASTDNVGVTGYKVYQEGTEITEVAGTSFSVTGLSSSTTYSFEVSAVDAAGNESARSTAVSVTTDTPSDTEAPTVPANLSASNTDTDSTDLSWNASTDNVGVTGYKVYQDGTEITEVAGTSFSVTGLSSSTTYSFEVSAVDAAGNESARSTAVSVTTDTPSDTEAPTVPTNLSASNTDTDSTDLSWNASTDNVGVTGYKVYQDGTEITEVAGTSFSVTGLSSSTTYSFEVSAVDAVGNESARSTALSVTTDAAVTSERVLVFSKTEGFRHGSIGAGQTALTELAAANNFTVEFSEDSNDFTSGNLALYDLVIFLNTTGDILNSTQEAAFEGYIQGGGAFMGIHSATDTEYDWAWYGGLVGAYFANHPSIQTADVQVMGMHPSINHLGSTWTRNDEWYNFQQLSTDITPVLNLDESSYSGGTMGSNHPIAWYQIYDGGRSFYTGMGHTNASYSESDFRQHLLGGILWCLNR